MALERQGKTRLQMRQSSLGAQQTTLRDLKTKLDALKAAAADLRSATTWSEGQAVESSDAARVAVARTGGAPIGGYSVKVTQLAASAQKTYAWTESASASQLTIDGITLDIPANAKIADVASTINGRGDLAVYAAVVGGDKLVLSSRATGAAATFSATGAQLSAPTNELAGRNAKYLLDGDVVERESTTNVVQDAIPGVRLTFKGTTAEAASIVVGAPGVDRDKVKAEVKAFVDAYNAVVTATRAKVGEKSVKDAATQTDFNKGAFFGDSGLNSMLSRLRSGMKRRVHGDRQRDVARRPARHRHLDRQGRHVDRGRQGRPADDRRREAHHRARERRKGVRKLLGGAGTAAFAQDVEALAADLSKQLDGRIESAGTQSRRIADDLTRTDARLLARRTG